MAISVNADQARLWLDVIDTLDDLLDRTSAVIGVYQDPEVKIGETQYRLHYTGTGYELCEPYA